MPLLEMSGVCKAFPGVLALDNVSFHLERGEVRALMGENGAGKSTLIKVLTGVFQPDEGSIILDGQAIEPRSTIHAQGLGVSTVYQEVNLVPNLSVAENVCLGSEGRGFGKINWRAMRARADEAMHRLNLSIDVARPLSDFSTAVQQLVAIARAVDREAKVLVLDEPTSSLDRDEVARLFELMKALKGQGLGILFVTHFIEQTYAISDSITVLRNGQKVGDWLTRELPKPQLVAHMLGRSLEEVPKVRHESGNARPPLLFVNGLGRKRKVQPLSFEVGEGETLGLSGLLGSGRTETLKLVYGALPADSGGISGLGARGARPRSPRETIRRGIGFCPEDRKEEAVFPGLSVADNLLLVLQAKRGWLRPIPKKSATDIFEEQKANLQIKAHDSARPIDHLSGGNQQKLVLARWLAVKPKLLLLDEPTRGIDVGSKLEIRKLVTDLARSGMSFMFTSSELEEVVNTCDRVLVLRDRKLVGELKGDQLTELQVMSKIAEDGE